MTHLSGRHLLFLTVPCLLLALGASTAAGQDTPPAPTNDDCLACHGDASAQRANGTSIFVDLKTFGASVHGQLELQCVACHTDLATAEMPHAEKLKPADCSACHDSTAFAASVHGKALAAGKTTAPTCASCHGAHDILPSKDPASRTNHLALIKTCGACHGATSQQAGAPGGNILDAFTDSIHGRALIRSGLTVAPSCVSCHGAHDIASRHDAASKVHRMQVADTCGACHEGIKRQFVGGRHGTLVQNGDPRAPVCADCHSAHQIQRVDRESWQVEVIEECGTCHTDKLRTYRDTFHGKVTELGFTRVATCASCHGAHQMLPASDPASPVSAERRQQTCQKCHAGVNWNFAQYDPHPDPHDRERNAMLYYTTKFMQLLLVGVFAFFGIHSGLWFGRSLQEVRHRRGHAPAPTETPAPPDTPPDAPPPAATPGPGEEGRR
jgi:hypothetical protein